MTWRHRWARGDTRCTVPDERDPQDICGCTDPTPDPASPCAVCGQPSRASVHDHVGLGTPIGGATVHFPTPTRCLTCGHPIEEARP